MTRRTLAEVTDLTRAVTRLMRTWRVPNHIAASLVGSPDQLFDVFLLRLSMLVEIHDCVRRILIHRRRSHESFHRPNTAFAGLSPLQLMASGDIASLHRVRAYLDG